MKCLTLKLLQTNGVMCNYYPLVFMFIFGILSNIFFNKYWTSIPFNKQSKQLIIHRPFSIIDFDDHDIYNTDPDKNAHELLIRETEVNVVCMLKLLYLVPMFNIITCDIYCGSPEQC